MESRTFWSLIVRRHDCNSDDRQNVLRLRLRFFDDTHLAFCRELLRFGDWLAVLFRYYAHYACCQLVKLTHPVPAEQSICWISSKHRVYRDWFAAWIESAKRQILSDICKRSKRSLSLSTEWNITPLSFSAELLAASLRRMLASSFKDDHRDA